MKLNRLQQLVFNAKGFFFPVGSMNCLKQNPDRQPRVSHVLALWNKLVKKALGKEHIDSCTKQKIHGLQEWAKYSLHVVLLLQGPYKIFRIVLLLCLSRIWTSEYLAAIKIICHKNAFTNLQCLQPCLNHRRKNGFCFSRVCKHFWNLIQQTRKEQEKKRAIQDPI